MKSHVLQTALTKALGPAGKDMCPTCAWPARQGGGVVLLNKREDLAICPTCGGPVDGEGVPLGILCSDGERYLKRVILADEPEDSLETT